LAPFIYLSLTGTESELTVIAVYISPEEAGLVIEASFVKGGKCDKQAFAGTLQRH
jgi:hypothetical protein